MENYEGGGDLTDIVRASGSSGNIQPEDWRFPSSDLMNFQPGIVEETTGIDDFGDPFSDLQDPLLQELNIGTSSSSFFFNSTTQISCSSTTTTNVTNIDRDQEKSCVFGSPQKMTMISLDDDQISPTTNSINNMTTMALQPVSPCDSSAASPRGSIIRASKVSLVDSTTCLQISSPPNPGNKRRKSQGKKVVCIPAPAPANSKCSGEIVPSDLWAWRKYGQKPIKGSPYPRGYYRCSSSKGCSARKQVERSRTDPNMLVITYTSEHNHPWPTQRNALAGSTRAQPSKSNAASQSQKPTNLKDQEFKESSNNKDINISSSNASVKEEMEDIDEKELDIDEGGQSSEGFPSSYKPAMPGEDFFADLGEIEADPLSLFRSGGDDSERGIKDLDPFSIFDWPGNNNYTSFGEAKRGL